MRLTLLSCTAALIAAPAFAADLGTYRPGTPYHSVIVPTANVCESQCEGDAQCRGWNYVKAAPNAPGVCEFQSSIGAPVSSAISISGVSNSAMPLSSRVIEGKTNTIRVGTAVIPKPAPATQTTQAGRQIVRHAAPRQSPQMGSMAQPGFRPALDGYAGAQPQMTRPTVSQGPARQSPQMRMTGPVAPQNGYQQPQFTQLYQGRPPIGQPIASAQATDVKGQFVPQARVVPAQSRGIPAQPQPMPKSSVNNPVSWESIRQPQSAPQQPSLYGQLNDDMRQPTPMPTVQSYPSQPVTQLPLAGAQPR